MRKFYRNPYRFFIPGNIISISGTVYDNFSGTLIKFPISYEPFTCRIYLVRIICNLLCSSLYVPDTNFRNLARKPTGTIERTTYITIPS